MTALPAADTQAEQPPRADLSELIPHHEWALHRRVIELAAERGFAFALGGGLAFSAYSGRWRNTKDVDLFIRPADRDAMVQVTLDAGFLDYFDKLEYDRTWIYRAYLDDVIVDLIWTMPNHRLEVDEDWQTRGWEIVVHGLRVRLIPPEELIWSKLFVMQRDRCDWPDLLNLLYGVGPEIDWDHLLERLGSDVPVLAGLMSLFRWLCPERARDLPEELWPRLGLPDRFVSADRDGARADLLDTRDWFGPTHGKEQT